LSDAFRLKIALLVIGVFVYLWLDQRIKTAKDPAPRRADYVLAVILILSWLSAGLAGRFIGLL
jgi:hypothetical protein